MILTHKTIYIPTKSNKNLTITRTMCDLETVGPGILSLGSVSVDTRVMKTGSEARE